MITIENVEEKRAQIRADVIIHLRDGESNTTTTWNISIAYFLTSTRRTGSSA